MIASGQRLMLERKTGIPTYPVFENHYYYRGTLGHKIFSTTLVPSEGRTPVFIRQLSEGALNAPQFESAGVVPTLTEGSYELPLQVTE